jgi:hypothetical protein
LLTILNVENWDCRRPLLLVRPKDRYLSPAQKAFLEFLEAERPAPARQAAPRLPVTARESFGLIE